MRLEPGHLLCLGFGYTAGFVARALIEQGWTVSGTTRDRQKLEGLSQAGINPVLWDTDKGEALAAAISNATHLLISVPPGSTGCPALAILRANLTILPAGLCIGYLSSNGVYGDHGGAWVDETTPTNPSTPRGKYRVAAERDWLSFSKDAALTTKILRLPGIYGPGRSALDTVRNATAQRIVKPGQVFSRMHVADIANAVIAGMTKPNPFDIYNLCDDEPAPPQDVIAFACTLLGVAPPPEIAFEDADLSPMGRSFYADNKRVRNERMKEALGVNLRFPTYREGLASILADDQMSSSDQ